MSDDEYDDYEKFVNSIRDLPSIDSDLVMNNEDEASYASNNISDQDEDEEEEEVSLLSDLDQDLHKELEDLLEEDFDFNMSYIGDFDDELPPAPSKPTGKSKTGLDLDETDKKEVKDKGKKGKPTVIKVTDSTPSKSPSSKVLRRRVSDGLDEELGNLSDKNSGEASKITDVQLMRLKRLLKCHVQLLLQGCLGYDRVLNDECWAMLRELDENRRDHVRAVLQYSKSNRLTRSQLNALNGGANAMGGDNIPEEDLSLFTYSYSPELEFYIEALQNKVVFEHPSFAKYSKMLSPATDIYKRSLPLSGRFYNKTNIVLEQIVIDIYSALCRNFFEASAKVLPCSKYVANDKLIPGGRNMLDLFTNAKDYLTDEQAKVFHEKQTLDPFNISDVSSNIMSGSSSSSQGGCESVSPPLTLEPANNPLLSMKHILTKGEDNLILRGINLFGEKNMSHLAERYFHTRRLSRVEDDFSDIDKSTDITITGPTITTTTAATNGQSSTTTTKSLSSRLNVRTLQSSRSSDTFLQTISHRYFMLQLHLFKAAGVEVDEEGSLIGYNDDEKAPRSVDSSKLPPGIFDDLKLVPEPNVYNVYRWTAAEDILLLKIVPKIGKQWAEIKRLGVPHRDRGGLRKRFQVLERRIKGVMRKVNAKKSGPSQAKVNKTKALKVSENTTKIQKVLVNPAFIMPPMVPFHPGVVPSAAQVSQMQAAGLLNFPPTVPFPPQTQKVGCGNSNNSTANQQEVSAVKAISLLKSAPFNPSSMVTPCLPFQIPIPAPNSKLSSRKLPLPTFGAKGKERSEEVLRAPAAPFSRLPITMASAAFTRFPNVSSTPQKKRRKQAHNWPCNDDGSPSNTRQQFERILNEQQFTKGSFSFLGANEDSLEAAANQFRSKQTTDLKQSLKENRHQTDSSSSSININNSKYRGELPATSLLSNVNKRVSIKEQQHHKDIATSGINSTRTTPSSSPSKWQKFSPVPLKNLGELSNLNVSERSRLAFFQGDEEEDTDDDSDAAMVLYNMASPAKQKKTSSTTTATTPAKRKTLHQALISSSPSEGVGGFTKKSLFDSVVGNKSVSKK